MKRKALKDPAVKICEVYFGRLLPGYLKEVGDRVFARGTLQVTLQSDRRRTWTVDLEKRTVHRGADVKPDALLETSAQSWVSIILGTLDMEAALECGCVRHEGDPRVTAGLFEILCALEGPAPTCHSPLRN
jgi:putative sterol carrier protein